MRHQTKCRSTLTTSTRRSTRHTYTPTCQHLFFNSRPPHGGRQKLHGCRYHGQGTSTHDLHTEVDFGEIKSCAVNGTSTHDLHTEVDEYRLYNDVLYRVLQLTTSTRRSTFLGAVMMLNDTLQLTTSTRRSTASFILFAS